MSDFFESAGVMSPSQNYPPNLMSMEPVSRTYQYRKIMKPMLERKRRARINRCLDELKDLMTGALQAVSVLLEIFLNKQQILYLLNLFDWLLNLYSNCHFSCLVLKDIFSIIGGPDFDYLISCLINTTEG